MDNRELNRPQQESDKQLQVEDKEPRLTDEQEAIIADRIEIASHILRQLGDGSSPVRDILVNPVRSAISFLAVNGNPITQVKMIRVCQNIPKVGFIGGMGGLLDSEIKWVYAQALIFASSKQGTHVLGSDLPTQMGIDLAQGGFAPNFTVYFKAAMKAGNFGSWWSLALGSFSYLLNLSLLLCVAAFAYKYASNLTINSIGSIGDFSWLKHLYAIAVYSGIILLATALSLRFGIRFLWPAILGSAIGSLILAQYIQATWSQPKFIFLIVPLLFALVPCIQILAIAGATIYFIGLAIFLAGTVYLRSSGDKAGRFFSIARNSFFWLGFETNVLKWEFRLLAILTIVGAVYQWPWILSPIAVIVKGVIFVILVVVGAILLAIITAIGWIFFVIVTLFKLCPFFAVVIFELGLVVAAIETTMLVIDITFSALIKGPKVIYKLPESVRKYGWFETTKRVLVRGYKQFLWEVGKKKILLFLVTTAFISLFIVYETVKLVWIGLTKVNDLSHPSNRLKARLLNNKLRFNTALTRIRHLRRGTLIKIVVGLGIIVTIKLLLSNITFDTSGVKAIFSASYITKAIIVVILVALLAFLFVFLRSQFPELSLNRVPINLKDKLTKDKWKDIIVSAKAGEQNSILRKTSHQLLDITPEEYLVVLKEIRDSIKEEPAASTYWAQRDELEQALKQEKLG